MSRERPGPTEGQLTLVAAISRSGPGHAETPSEELLAPWADQVYRWLNVDQLRLTRIWELLAQRGSQVSYSSLYRFVARRKWRGRNRTTVRMDANGPGEVAELDFGRLGFIKDPETGRRRTVWALIVVLTHSRHSFVWPTKPDKIKNFHPEALLGPVIVPWSCLLLNGQPAAYTGHYSWPSVHGRAIIRYGN